MTTITCNRAQCVACKDIIESKFRHDFQVCSCWHKGTGIAVDGGLDYLKRCGMASNILELSTYDACSVVKEDDCEGCS